MTHMSTHASRAISGLFVLLFVAAVHASPAEEDYETPPEIVASEALASELATGTDHRVGDPVHNDGLMNHYSLQSRFGNFEVAGRTMLEIRIREIGALAELERVSKSEVFLKAIASSAIAPVETVADVVQQPIATITGIPRGVANLFKTYKVKARDATGDVRREAAEIREPNAAGGDGAAAKRVQSYAAKHLGVSQAERRWYAKLGVDPYTTNTELRAGVRKVAKVDATARFGVRYAGVPGLAGIGAVRKGIDAIWEEDTVLIRERNRSFLASIGGDREEVARFENNLWLSPTHQVAILAMVRALDGVEGRGELIRRAIEVDSEDEALALIDSIGLLVGLHEKTPLAGIQGGVRLPVARTADGRLVVCAGFESVHWTENVAAGAREIAARYRDEEVSERQVWLAGAGSARVRAELQTLGWKLFDRTDVAGAD